MTLKDGLVAILQLDMNAERDNAVVIRATIAGEPTGTLHLGLNDVPDDDLHGDDQGSWSATNVWVNREYIRKGLASAMYDFATKLGFRILSNNRQ